MDPKLEACYEVHQKEYGISPTIVASAPGKVNLLGDYTEFAKGCALSAALACRVYVSVSGRTDSLVRFYSREYNERKKTATSNLKFRKEDRWANYPKGVLAAFGQLGVRIEGLDVSICGDIPQGIGLGSSQALCLAAAFAYNEYFQTSLAPLQMIQIAQRAETGFLNQYSDTASAYVQAFAQADHLFWMDYRSFDWELLAFPADVGELAVVNSRVPASSFDSSAARAREECELCLKHLNGSRTNRSLRDYTRTDLRERVGTLPESARRRSLHVIDEIARSLEAKDAFLSGD